MAIGCSSVQDQAQTAYEQGSYDKAALLFEQARQENPSDPEVLEGLARSRNRIVEGELKQVHSLRLSGKEEEAAAFMLKIINSERTWKLNVEPGILLRQDEELVHIRKYVESSAGQYVNRRYPLAALAYLGNYENIYSGSLQQYSEIKEKIIAAGVKTCNDFRKPIHTGLPYYAAFADRYCALWGVAAAHPNAAREAFRRRDLIGSAKLSIKIAGMPDAILSRYEESIRAAIQKIPWYDEKAPGKLQLQLSGTLEHHVSQTKENRSHAYTVQEPYTAFETVVKTRQVPYSALENQCVYDYSGNMACALVTVTKYRPDMYTEQVPVTKFREVPKTQPYEGTQYRQSLGLSLQGTLKIGKRSAPLGFAERANHQDFEHNWNMPDIGLTPHHAQLLDAGEWFAGQARGIGDMVIRVSRDAWKAAFCTPGGKTSMPELGERVHKCMAGGHTGAPFVNAWYEKHLGLSIEQAMAYLK